MVKKENSTIPIIIDFVTEGVRSRTVTAIVVMLAYVLLVLVFVDRIPPPSPFVDRVSSKTILSSFYNINQPI